MKCSLNSGKRAWRSIVLNCMFLWLFNLKQSLGDYNKHTKGLLMDIDYLVSQLYVQRCAFVEIGEGICSLFVELPLDGKGCSTQQVFLGQCSCAELSSWQLCGRKLAEQRPEDCTLEPERPVTSARVHYRLCDLTGMAQWNPQCKCPQPQQEPLCGFRTCYSNPLPSSICSPRSPCGTASCDLALHGSLYSIQCDPSCKHHLPFCERPSPATSTRRDVSSDWTEWRPISSSDQSNVQQFVADCLTHDRKPAFDCIGPGLKCCGDEEVDCICEVKLEEGALKAFRYSITFSADRPDHNSIKARSPIYKTQPQVWNRFIDLASRGDKSSDSLFAIQETKNKNNQKHFASKLSEGDRDQVESANMSHQGNIKDVYQHINEFLSHSTVDSTLKNNVKLNEELISKDPNIMSTSPLLRNDSVHLLQETDGKPVIKPVTDGKLVTNIYENDRMKIKNTLIKDKTLDNSRLTKTNHVMNYINNNIEAESSSISNKSGTSNPKNSQNYSEGTESHSFKEFNYTLKDYANSQIKTQTAHNLTHSDKNKKAKGNNKSLNDDDGLKKKMVANRTGESKYASKNKNNELQHNTKMINKDSETKDMLPIHNNISEIKPDSKNQIMTTDLQHGHQLKATSATQPNRDKNSHGTNSNHQDTRKHETNNMNKIQNSKPDLDKVVKNNQHNSQSKLKTNDDKNLPREHISSSNLQQVHISKNDNGNSSRAKVKSQLDSQSFYKGKHQKANKDELPKNVQISEPSKEKPIRPSQIKKTTPALEFISDIVDLLPNSTPTIPNTTSHFGITTIKNLNNVTSFFVNPSYTALNIAETTYLNTNVTPKLTLANVARKIFSSPDILSDQKDPLNKVQSVDLLSLAVENYDERGDTTLEKLYDEPEPVLKDLNVDSVDDKMANALSSIIGVKHDPQKSTWTQINKKQKQSSDEPVAKQESYGSKLQAIATTIGKA